MNQSDRKQNLTDPEIDFDKYRTRGADYHWQQISKNLRKRNLYVLARYKKIIECIDFSNTPRILDLGCGDGVLSYLLWQRGASVIGLDISKKAISYAKARTRNFKGLDFVIGNVYDIPFDDNNFNWVVASDVIEHVQDPEKMVDEIKRVLKPGASTIISSPIKFTETPRDKMHVQEFFPEEYKRIFTKQFNSVRIIYSHPIFWTELQNKTVFGRTLFRIIINLLNLVFGFNPFLSENGWSYFTMQFAICKKKGENSV